MDNNELLSTIDELLEETKREVAYVSETNEPDESEEVELNDDSGTSDFGTGEEQLEENELPDPYPSESVPEENVSQEPLD